jgi:hypothetical protein
MSKASLPVVPATQVALPAIADVTGQMLTALTDALGVDRGVLATDKQIEHAWINLPRLLARSLVLRILEIA